MRRLIFILIFLLMLQIVYAPCETRQDGTLQCEPITDMPSNEVINQWNALTSEQRASLSEPQLAAVIQQQTPQALGDLGQYSTNREALISALQSSGYDINNLNGDLNGVNFEGNTLVIGNSKFDAKTGKPFDIEVAGDDSIKSFSTNDNSVSFFNAKGVIYSAGQLTIASADSVSWFGATTNQVLNFAGQSGTFSIQSADRVIVETMTFDKIINSIFKVSNGNLISASIECNKNNSQTTFPSLVAGTSNSITSTCGENQKYSIAYREKADEHVFNATENITLFLKGNYANITFKASNGSSLIIRPNGIFEVKNGILSFIAPTFTEQLEGNCLDYSAVQIDFANGFLKTTLFPFSDYRTGIFICPGARYNRLYSSKENSFSIYNIGKTSYYLVFNKNLQILNELFNSNGNDDNYGFITENISLNGNIEYDRIPEKALFPAISQEEYNSLSIDWKKVYASYDPKTRTGISGQNKIAIISKNKNGTSETNVEINSGYFKIREIGNSRFASFNRNMTYPDYVSRYFYNNAPEIKIENKMLTEQSDSRVTKMFTPGTSEISQMLDWLKNRFAIKDLSEWLQASRTNIEVSST